MRHKVLPLGVAAIASLGSTGLLLTFGLIACTDRSGVEAATPNPTDTVHEVTEDPSDAQSLTGTGDHPWGEPGNVFFVDGTTAELAPLPNWPLGDYSEVLLSTSYGFSIPQDATILGVIVTVTWGDSAYSTPGTQAREASVELYYNGSSISANRSTGALIPIGCSCATYYGGDSDTWSATLTPSILNSSSFGVGLGVLNPDSSGSTANTVDVDAVSITIYYATT